MAIVFRKINHKRVIGLKSENIGVWPIIQIQYTYATL